MEIIFVCKIGSSFLNIFDIELEFNVGCIRWNGKNKVSI